MQINKSALLERFKSYVKYETTSDEKATCFPSTAKQLDLARYLVTELEALGLSEVELTEYGYVLATLPANTEETRDASSIPEVAKTSWSRKWQPTLVFLSGKFHGQRSLAGYGPWGHKRVGRN